MFKQTWTDEQVDLLKKLIAENYSAAQIAREIGGFTRNAVLGKIHRLGLSHTRVVVQKRPGPRKPKARVERRPDWLDKARTSVRIAEPVFIETPIDDMAIPTEQRKSLLELENCHCRWPVGEPGKEGFFFCGLPTADVAAGRPYCASHANVAISKSGTTRARLHAEARDQEWKDKQRRRAA